MLSLKPFAAAALATFVGFSAPSDAAPLVDGTPITATLSQDFYELGETLELTITAPPGTYCCIAIDTVLGQFSLGGIMIDLAHSPAFMMSDIGFMPESGSITVKLPTSCKNFPLTQGPLYVQVGGLPTNPIGEVCLTEVQTVLVGNGDCNVCVTAAVQDPNVSDLPTTGAFHFPGLGGDFDFESQPELSEYADGTATLSGVLRAQGDATRRFLFNAQLTGRLDVVDAAFPPAGSPALKLKPTAYLDNGGTVDPRNWHYYTDFAGDMIGLDGLVGAYVTLDEFGGATQFGRGASGKGIKYGACGGLNAVVDVQPTNGTVLASSDQSQMTIQTGICTPTLEDICVDPSQVSGHALYWPEVSKHFMPVGKLTFEEYADGTARVQGKVAVQGDASKCFDMDIRFSDRVDNGNANFPPSGSPKWGNVDPNTADESTWHYYLKTEGVLNGCEAFEGAVILLDRMGPAFQVGVGANYHDLDYGGSGWLNLDVVKQPNSGTPFNAHTTGDINFDFVVCPVDGPPLPATAPIAHWDFTDQSGTKVRDRVGDVDLYFDGDEFSWVNDTKGMGLKFKKDNKDMLKTSSTSMGSALRTKLQHSNALTLQVYYTQKEGSDDDARLFSWSTGTDMNNRNLTLISDWSNNSFSSEARVKTTDSTSSIKKSLGVGQDTPIVLTMTWSQADGKVRTYLDGVLIDTANHTGSLSNWSEHNIRLGNEEGGERSFKGTMYDVKIWDAALTDAQVLEVATAVKP